ncbi:hypothetical protein H3H36_18695 [Duganella sp. FT3S]|uniref:Uncharacterized protein n=1 Tax=Rugamonas fusca TaxID=2758568 RepID=A0A7W2EK49_9BURK|nr:hypothetical protein [Rugamonas fusca]MBA5607389.1 hypothetical protein [Rugamonas fusca]
MPIDKGERFTREDIFVDYFIEEVMFRWDHVTKKIYVRFYGKDESLHPVPYDNRLFNDALLGGDEISREEYGRGKDRWS